MLDYDAWRQAPWVLHFMDMSQGGEDYKQRGKWTKGEYRTWFL